MLHDSILNSPFSKQQLFFPIFLQFWTKLEIGMDSYLWTHLKEQFQRILPGALLYCYLRSENGEAPVQLSRSDAEERQIYCTTGTIQRKEFFKIHSFRPKLKVQPLLEFDPSCPWMVAALASMTNSS